MTTNGIEQVKRLMSEESDPEILRLAQLLLDTLPTRKVVEQ